MKKPLLLLLHLLYPILNLYGQNIKLTPHPNTITFEVGCIQLPTSFIISYDSLHDNLSIEAARFCSTLNTSLHKNRMGWQPTILGILGPATSNECGRSWMDSTRTERLVLFPPTHVYGSALA